MGDGPRLDERFLVLAPTGRDAALTCALLDRAGLAAVACPDVDALCRETERGAAALLLAEEVLSPRGARAVTALVAAQEPWSDLPVLIFTGEGATIQARHPTLALLAPLGNVTLLDRPLRPITMVSAARAALRARRRQYEAREELARRQVALRQRDQFLAMLGHELRNPLGTILLAAEMLGRTPDVLKQRDVIRRQGRRLSRLVDDLLEVARVTSGKVVLHNQSVDLNELVEACVQSAASASEGRPALALARAPGPVVVQGDPVRLEQVFGNLLTNAVKYTPQEGRVAVTVEGHAGEALVRVRDTGVGIAPEVLPHVFELFAQAEGTLDRAQGGLGIGLTLVRTLVELHGGAVSAASEGVGHGSEFVVRLPRGDAGALVAPRASGGCAAGPARRVLVIEDNVDARELLVALVAGRGHAVASAGDGVAGVARALDLRPEVVIVDIGLPGLDGYGVARRLRAELGAGVRLVAVTGYGQPEDRRRALDAGFDAHFTKPLDADRLREVLGEPAALAT